MPLVPFSKDLCGAMTPEQAGRFYRACERTVYNWERAGVADVDESVARTIEMSRSRTIFPLAPLPACLHAQPEVRQMVNLVETGQPDLAIALGNALLRGDPTCRTGQPLELSEVERYLVAVKLARAWNFSPAELPESAFEFIRSSTVEVSERVRALQLLEFSPEWHAWTFVRVYLCTYWLSVLGQVAGLAKEPHLEHRVRVAKEIIRDIHEMELVSTAKKLGKQYGPLVALVGWNVAQYASLVGQQGVDLFNDAQHLMVRGLGSKRYVAVLVPKLLKDSDTGPMFTRFPSVNRTLMKRANHFVEVDADGERVAVPFRDEPPPAKHPPERPAAA